MDRETGFSVVQNPWIPVTPAKQRPICEAKQENHQTQANWPREQRFPGGQSDQACWLELQGIQAQGRASTSGYTNKHFDNGEGALATKSQVYNFFQESAENLRNLPCQSLLALADATTYSVNATNQATDNVTSSSFTSILSNGMEDIPFSTISATTPPPEHDPSLGSNFGANGCKENIPQYGCSVLGRPSFDLNSPPKKTKDAAASRRIISEFAPMTPEQAKHRGENKTSTPPNLCVDERTLQDTSQQMTEVGSEGTKPHQLQNHEELSEVPRDNTISSVSTHLQEDHNPDMGGNHGTDLIKTPLHKQRRKKHRPKVVIEGQTKRTPKTTAPKPDGPTVTSTGKRKYVRKNSVDKQTTILSSEANSRVENPVGKRKYVRRKGLDKKTPLISAEAISGMENPKQKRKYVRRNGSKKQETTNLDEAIDGTLNPSTTGYTTKSCRRSLNFDRDSQVGDKKSPCNVSLDIELNSGEQNIYADRLRPRSRVVKLGDGIEVMVEKTEVGIAYDLSRSINQDLNSYLSMTELQYASHLSKTEQQSTSPSQSRLTANGLHESTRGRCQIVFSDQTHDKDASTAQKMLNANTQLAPRSPNESNCSTSAYLASEQASGQKRDRSTLDQAEHSSTRGIESHCNFQQAYPVKSPSQAYNNENSRLMFFPAFYKKKRTEKGNNSATSSMPYMMNAQVDANYIKLDHNYIISADQLNTANITTEQTTASDSHNKYHIGECLLALTDKERKTKRRSKGLTRVRNSISLIGILKHKQVSTHARKSTSNVEQTFELLSHRHTCMEALVADTNATMSTKKRTKKNSIATSVPPSMYTKCQFRYKLIGAPLDVRRKNILSVDAITEQLKHLDINQEQNALIPYNLKYPELNALAIYQRDGTLVTVDPSNGTLVPFNPVKRQQPRPKVDLDDETIRVWKLLLQDIDNEGIDGTDEEKVKWWKEERRVFQGRADSFIARMHLVQGDRRFSPWKGSVVDSVIGVFLTQNVSDHLSSSAFMALASRYPVKNKMFHQEGTSIVVKEPQDVECDEDREHINSTGSCGSSTLSVSLTEHSSSKLFESPINSPHVYHESAGSGSATEITETVGFMADQREIYDVLPCQSSMVSSESSVKNPNAELTATSKLRVFDASTSFLELLQKAGNGTLHQAHNQEADDMSSNKNDGENQSESTCDLLEHMKKPGDPNDSLVRVISPSIYSLHLTSNGASEVNRTNFSGRENNFPNIFEGNEGNYTSEQSGSSAETARLPGVPKNMTTGSQGPAFTGENDQECSNLEAEANKIPDQQIVGIHDSKNNLISHFQSQMQQTPDDTNLSGETLDVMERISITNDSGRIIESNLSENCNIFLEKEDGKTANTIEPTRDRIRKDKEKAYDWDGLRKHTQADGKQRERTANTMDSVDWEAVRRADVKQIAKTIKGRGMNNMLAERIKDFLNRLVKEHGSIDLEWLRDIPPDKAKEYLLSFWGLGLKSVECVRLLTLHHLAFPVDTNVGRIAVRLGWVPIQPLPESLQLHLLELYPVLESIQKYLWPRLCRLDQRTLYELHYQMITFGKVFCTKSKPNCNACPMRGECRHFASAFASARLALPAPEEKSIVDITRNKASTPSSRGITNPLLLPYTQIGQPPSTLPEGTIREPIIEEPATPEAEQTPVAESDIEDTFCEDPNEIPTIKLNIEEFTQNLQNYMQRNMELQDVDMSKALVALTPEAASIPMPKLKSMNRLRTEHQVYQLPDSHPLLEGLEKRETDDPCPYLLAIWTPGETANSIQPPEKQCSSQESGNLCNETTCFSCNSLREANSRTVRGTLLIPCRTAMRGSFPLNGTYFQVNEVFADHDSSLKPIDVPRDWIWNLPRRIVYFGTSIPTIFRGLTTEEIQQCFWRGFVCVRGFDQRKRAPRPLIARLHFPASKLPRRRRKTDENYLE